MQPIIKINYRKLQTDVIILANMIDKSKYNNIYAIPRGGVVVGALLSSHLGIPLADAPKDKTLIVDDLIDSGKTLLPYIENGYDVAVLYRKPYSLEPSNNLYIVETIDNWIEFPFENTDNDIGDNIIRIIQYTDNQEIKKKMINLAKEISIDIKIPLNKMNIEEK